MMRIRNWLLGASIGVGLGAASLGLAAVAFAQTPPKRQAPPSAPPPAELSTSEIAAAFAAAHPKLVVDPTASYRFDVAHGTVANGASLFLGGADVYFAHKEAYFFSDPNGLIEINGMPAKKGLAYLVDCRITPLGAPPKSITVWTGDTDASGVSANAKRSGVAIQHGHVLVPFVAGRDGTWMMTIDASKLLLGFHSCAVHPQKG